MCCSVSFRCSVFLLAHAQARSAIVNSLPIMHGFGWWVPLQCSISVTSIFMDALARGSIGSILFNLKRVSRNSRIVSIPNMFVLDATIRAS